MPISKENAALYPHDWKCIRAEVLERDEHRCKICKVKNYDLIARTPDRKRYESPYGVFDAETGERLGDIRPDDCEGGKTTKIVLTIAHLNHNPQDNGEPGRRPNLSALCQFHHLAHDHEHHQKNAAQTRRRRLGNGELFV